MIWLFALFRKSLCWAQFVVISNNLKMKNEKLFERIKSSRIGIINQGQLKEYSLDFTKDPKPYLHITAWRIFFPILLIFFLTTIIYYFLEPTIRGSKQYENMWNVFFETYKILITTFTVVLITIFLTNRWQQRTHSFEMIKELNSPEFLQIRNNLSNKMRKAKIDKVDIDNIKSWFPFTDSSINSICNPENSYVEYSIDDFIKEHALSNMMYFILRLSNYYKFDMLNIKLTKHLFHFFFCHYEVVMLEFAESLEQCRKSLNSEGYPYDERWNLVSTDIRNFFQLIGLGGRLPNDHYYLYFPSLNNK